MSFQGSPPPPQGGYYPPPPEKGHDQSQPAMQQFAPPPQQYAPPPQQYAPPPQQGYPPPQGQYFPPPQFSPPPQQPQGGFAPPPQQPSAPEVNRMSQMPPTPQPVASPSASVISDTVGQFNGGSYRIDHRDCNTLLTMQLAQGCPITAKPGAMVAMSPSVTLKGSMKVSLKKLISGGEMAHSTFTGPGEVLLAPAALGDVVPIRLDGSQQWNCGKDSFLANTPGVIKDYKSQGLGKAMFSGEGLFIYKIGGIGIMFVTSLGAIIQKNLQANEQYIVDNSHLVAWNCKYVLERVASGGLISSLSSAEGLVCKFTGPGTVFIQTRNPVAFGAWLGSHMPSGGGSY